MKKIVIINGPNLNLLGVREPDIYGRVSFSDFYNEMVDKYSSSVDLEYFQSNNEGEIIDKIHLYGFNGNGIILNAAAYTHTSVAIHDAIKSINNRVIEVHISNPHSRDSFRNNSYISPVSWGIISGFGLKSYQLAIEAFLD